MAIGDKIISFWKQVKLKSSDMFTLFRVGVGVKFPTHKFHVKDSTDPVKIEGLQNDATDPDKFLTIDSSNIVKYRTGAQVLTDIGGTPLTTEEVQDIAGALVATGGTKTGITVTYDDANNDMDFVVSPTTTVKLEVRNDEGTTIPAGAPLYSRGEIGSSNRIKVGICDADEADKMPCIGIAEADMNTTSTKDNYAISQGVYNTDISGFTGLAVGDNLYVSIVGTLLQSKPTGETRLIQNVGIVLKTNGTICQGLLVSAIGRTNDVPNLDQNALFIGNASNQAAATDAPMVGLITAADGAAAKAVLGDINLTSEVTGALPVANGGTGATSASDARSNLGVDAAGTDNSTNVTLAGTPDYITISGQEITRNAVDLAADVTGTLPVANGGTGLTSIAADTIVTGNGTGALTSEAYLTYNTSDEEMIIGNPDAGDAKVSRRNSVGTDVAGGKLIISAGAATGDAAGGSIEFHSSVAGSSGTSVQSTAEVATIDKDGNLSIDGDLTVKGNDIKDDDGTTCITFDSSGNTTIAGTTSGTFSGNLTGNASGSSGSCTGNAATATALTTGNKTIDGNLTIGSNGAGHDLLVYGDTALANMMWDSTYDFLKFSDNAKIVFGSGSHASDFDSSIQADGSNLVIYNDTGNIQIGDTVEITGDLTTTGSIELGHATDTTIARSAAGEVTIEGKKVITENKVRQQFNLSFVDDIATTEHYLSWRDQYENSTNTASDFHDTNYLVPANGRVVCVYLRVGNRTANSDTTIRVYSQNAGFMQSQVSQETEAVTVTSSDDFEVIAFYFDDAEHFQAGDLVLISIQDSVDSGGSQTYNVTAVLEFDYTQMGRTDSGELP